MLCIILSVKKNRISFHLFVCKNISNIEVVIVIEKINLHVKMRLPPSYVTGLQSIHIQLSHPIV